MAKVAVILCDHCESIIDENNVGFSFHGNVFKVTGVDAHGEEKVEASLAIILFLMKKKTVSCWGIFRITVEFAP